MTELVNVRCEKCDKLNQPGVIIGRMANMWLCGECIMTMTERLNKLKKKILFEE